LKASAEVKKGQKILDGCDQELKESKEDVAELTKQAGDMGKASSESLIVLLFKVGTKIKIPERRVFGEHPQMDVAIERIIDRNVGESVQEMMNQIKS